MYLTSVSIVWTPSTSQGPAAPTFSPASGTTFGDEGLSVTLTQADGKDIYYTTDGLDPTSKSTKYTSAIALTQTTTIKAVAYDGSEYSSIVTATYTYVDPNAPGTENNPYTVAQARAAIDAGSGTQGVYATGIVTAIPTEWSTQHSNITFNIVDQSGDTDFLQAYRCVSTSNADASTIAVGDIVVVYGNLTKYNTTYEFGQGCELVSLTHPTVTVEAPTFSPAAGTYADAQNVTISCATDGASIYYTTDGTVPSSASTKYTGPIAVSTYTTIKAIAINGSDESTVATASYHFCSATSPYTVTEALAFSEYPANGIYVSGIVSTAPTQAPTENGQMTYYISVDGQANNQLEVYKGKGLDQAAFAAKDDIQVGDEVTIFGNVKVYNSTIEFDTNNYLVAFNRPAAPVGTIALNWNNPDGVTVHIVNAEDNTIEYSNGDKVAKNTTIKVVIDKPAYYEVTSILVQDGTQNFDMASYANWVFTVLNEGDITITISVTDTRTVTELSYASDGSQWDASTQTVTISSASEFVQPALFINNGTPIDNEITYSSSNTAVATVATNGAVTIVGPGTAVITATFAGNINYQPSSASFTIVYNDGSQPTGDQFVKVTSTADLTDGEYLIVYEDGALAFNGGLTTLDAASNTISVTIANDAIAKTDDNYAARFTLTADNGNYTIQAASGKYIGNASDSNALTASDAPQANTITIATDGEANIIGAGGAYLRYNATSGQERFRYYKSASYSSQKAIALYKFSGTADERQAVTLTFENVPSEININETSTYAATSSVDGLTITYASSDDNIVMVDANTGEIGALAVGEATITATFAGDNTYKPASASYTITVVDPSNVPTYYALVAQYNGKFYAMNEKGGATWGATEVDAVNGKVVSAQTDEISWEISPATPASTTKVKFQNVSSGKYLNYTSSASLSEGATSANWDIDESNHSWTNNSSRSMVYRENAKGFKNYAVSNINTSDYSDYTHAYTFADGYVRTVTANNYGTFCVDHTIAADDYSGVKFYSIAGKIVNSTNEPTSIVLKEETGELLAGVAYIFQANDDAEKLVAAYSDEDINEPFVAADNNGLAGSFTGTAVAEDKYLLYSGQIVKCGTGCSIGENRAYIDMKAVPVYNGGGNNVKMLGVDGFIVDGINATENGQLTMGNAKIFNIAGQRLQRPVRGINIINGKKVLVK